MLNFSAICSFAMDDLHNYVADVYPASLDVAHFVLVILGIFYFLQNLKMFTPSILILIYTMIYQQWPSLSSSLPPTSYGVYLGLFGQLAVMSYQFMTTVSLDMLICTSTVVVAMIEHMATTSSINLHKLTVSSAVFIAACGILCGKWAQFLCKSRAQASNLLLLPLILALTAFLYFDQIVVISFGLILAKRVVTWICKSWKRCVFMVLVLTLATFVISAYSPTSSFHDVVNRVQLLGRQWYHEFAQHCCKDLPPQEPKWVYVPDTEKVKAEPGVWARICAWWGYELEPVFTSKEVLRKKEVVIGCVERTTEYLTHHTFDVYRPKTYLGPLKTLYELDLTGFVQERLVASVKQAWRVFEIYFSSNHILSTVSGAIPSVFYYPVIITKLCGRRVVDSVTLFFNALVGVPGHLLNKSLYLSGLILQASMTAFRMSLSWIVSSCFFWTIMLCASFLNHALCMSIEDELALTGFHRVQYKVDRMIFNAAWPVLCNIITSCCKACLNQVPCPSLQITLLSYRFTIPETYTRPAVIVIPCSILVLLATLLLDCLTFRVILVLLTLFQILFIPAIVGLCTKLDAERARSEDWKADALQGNEDRVINQSRIRRLEKRIAKDEGIKTRQAATVTSYSEAAASNFFTIEEQRLEITTQDDLLFKKDGMITEQSDVIMKLSTEVSTLQKIVSLMEEQKADAEKDKKQSKLRTTKVLDLQKRLEEAEGRSEAREKVVADLRNQLALAQGGKTKAAEEKSRADKKAADAEVELMRLRAHVQTQGATIADEQGNSAKVKKDLKQVNADLAKLQATFNALQIDYITQGDLLAAARGDVETKEAQRKAFENDIANLAVVHNAVVEKISELGTPELGLRAMIVSEFRPTVEGQFESQIPVSFGHIACHVNLSSPQIASDGTVCAEVTMYYDMNVITTGLVPLIALSLIDDRGLAQQNQPPAPDDSHDSHDYDNSAYTQGQSDSYPDPSGEDSHDSGGDGDPAHYPQAEYPDLNGNGNVYDFGGGGGPAQHQHTESLRPGAGGSIQIQENPSTTQGDGGNGMDGVNSNVQPPQSPSQIHNNGDLRDDHRTDGHGQSQLIQPPVPNTAHDAQDHRSKGATTANPPSSRQETRTSEVEIIVVGGNARRVRPTRRSRAQKPAPPSNETPMFQ